MWRPLTVRRVAVDRLWSSIATTAPRYLSSAVPPPQRVETEKEGDHHPQPFVDAEILPGEWDGNRTDPYFRPKPHNRSNFISAEDFANRPPVGFDGEFTTFQDAMISLSWMDQRMCREIYDAYTRLMIASQENHKTTSHEYVVRVVAQRYHITTARAAGIIQLQHAEEQMRQHKPELLCSEHANHAEGLILENIRDAYRSERSQPPGQQPNSSRSLPFIEDPVGIHGRGEPDETSTQWANLDDIFDMEQKLAQATVRDNERAKIIINNHIYKEDIDEEEQLVKVDTSGRKLIVVKDKLKKEMATLEDSIPYPETNGKGEKRGRWKYVAQIVNTRSLKRKQVGRRGKSSSTSYTNNKMGNTLVEHDGELRIATVTEAKQTAWKPTRTRSNEYLFEGAKKAWLERTLKGKTSVWGLAPRTRASDSAPEKASAKTTEADTLEEVTESQAETAKQPEIEQSIEEAEVDVSSPEKDEAPGEGPADEASGKKST